MPSGANSPKSHKVGYESQFASVLAYDYAHLCTAYTAYSRNYAVQGNATFTARASDSSKCLPNWLLFKIRQFLEPVAVSKYHTLVPFFSVSTCFFYQASSFIFLSRSSPCTTALWCFSRSCSISVARPDASSEAFAKSASRPGSNNCLQRN